MSNLQKLSVAAIATAAVLIGANSANAASLTITSTPGPFVDQSTAFDAPPVGYSYTGGAVVQGTLTNKYAKPLGDTTKYLTVSPLNSGVAGDTGFVTIALNSVENYFSLYWGSIDSENEIEFYKGNTLIGKFFGSDVPGSTHSGSQTSLTDNRYVQFSGADFDKVVLNANNKIAFESDDYIFKRVPEPASIVGLLAFGVLGAGSLVKRTLKVV